MPAPSRSASTEFAVRTFRFLGAMAALLALFAVVAMMSGDSNDRNRDLVALSILLGAGALLGLPLLIIAHVHRRKDRHDNGT